MPISPSANSFWITAYFSPVSAVRSLRTRVVLPDPKNPTSRYILAGFYIFIMIRDRYKVVHTHKQKDYKCMLVC